MPAVLADVTHHEPVRLPARTAGSRNLGERDVPPGGGTQVKSVVVARPGPVEIVERQLVPLLARDLTGFAADAEGGVG
jgi:hypothetical protein